MRIEKLSNLEFNKYQRDAAKLTKQLQSQGHLALWVGGAVRDMLLHRENFDIDLATSATPEQTKRVLKKLGLRFFVIGEKFGTVTALLPAGRKAEITSFRSEKGYADFRHPSKVKFGVSPEVDASRRDFTINSLFFNPVRNELLDYHNGLKDLKAKRVKFVGSAAERIKEDPLRSLRAIRFAATLGFKIASQDFAQIKKSAPLTKKISGQRIKQELDRLISDDNYMHGLRLLDQSGLLAQIFPEVERLKKVKQSKNYHTEGSAFKHTMMVVENLRSGDLTMRYAGLLHDIGKFGTGKKTFKEARPHISFHGHAQKSAELSKKITRRLGFTREQSQKIWYLLLHHMDLRPIETIREKTLIRWAKHPWFGDQIRLRIADSLGAKQTDMSGRVVNKEMGDWENLLKKVSRWQKLQPRKIIDGRDVMRILKIKSGKAVGEILEEVHFLVRKGKIKNREQGITFLKSLDKQKH